jgi:hypothetical protein
MHPEEHKVTVGRLSWRPLSFQTQRAMSAFDRFAQNGHGAMSAMSPLGAQKRTSTIRHFDPFKICALD